eukprot:CAMPEP_0201945702 /NCGR_PEP_ID=MMETSP0903-20130614/54036_1 /ASSEMBLY_ACC=CAM_ASM_000552 /TAXON_ID=420261 /ORGANISM="Thalassiosira antarctica, Strain CCMP982" /LENGTH=734 /DNA_ID=CAMNT_0048488773 /DNA_START=231 /DNA_END=2435 /DNA_ORIENTATION=+
MSSNQPKHHAKPQLNPGVHTPVAAKPGEAEGASKPPSPLPVVTATGAKELGSNKFTSSNKQQGNPFSVMDQKSPPIKQAKKKASMGGNESNSGFNTATEMAPTPPSGHELIDGDRGSPSPPVAMNSASAMNKDAMIERGVDGAKSAGLELNDNDVGSLGLPPKAAAGGAKEDSSFGKSTMSKNIAIAASGTLLQTPTELTPPTPFKSVMFDDEEDPTELTPPTPFKYGKARAGGAASKSNDFERMNVADQFEQRMRMKLAKEKVKTSSRGTNGRRAQEPSNQSSIVAKVRRFEEEWRRLQMTDSNQPNRHDNNVGSSGLPPKVAAGGAKEDSSLGKPAISKNIAASGTLLQTPTELTPPTPFKYAMFDDEEEGKKHRDIHSKIIADSGTLLQTPTELTPPTPFKSVMFDDEEEAKKHQAIGSDEDSIIYPTIEEMEDEVVFNVNPSDDATAQPANRGQRPSTTVPRVSTASSRPSRAPQRENDQRRSQRQRLPAEVTTGPPSPQPMLSPPIDEENPLSLPTLEATLVVENNEPSVPNYIPVYEATRISATKRYKNYILVGLFSLVFGGMAAIIFGGGDNNGVGGEMQPSEQTPSMTPPTSPPDLGEMQPIDQTPSMTPSTSPSTNGSDPATCGCDTVLQADYRGTISTTASDTYTCQRWDSQSPHSHEYTPQSYPDKGLENNNYCRNPNGSTTPKAWCYTTDPSMRWTYCDVPSCVAPCVDQTTSMTPSTSPSK